jgi:hypothetical protein
LDYFALEVSLTTKGRADQLRHAEEKEQRIIDLERELKEVREVAATDKKRLEDELVEERRKAMEATAQFNTAATSEFFSLRPFFKPGH